MTATSEMPTKHGMFTATTFKDKLTGSEHIALSMGDLAQKATIPVRVHSECLTGEAMGSLRCDCGEQLQMSMAMIAKEGAGVLIYLRGHEGRGIGLGKKIEAYHLQDTGLDTLEANRALGLPDDARDYVAAASILKQMEIKEIVLLTNNPGKVDALVDAGVRVVARRSLIVASQAENVSYLRTKQEKFGHFLEPAWALEAG